MKCFLRLNDLFSQGSRQGTLMPGLLNLWYEQLSYPKILPLVCNLSIEISLQRAILVKHVLACSGQCKQNFTGMAEPSRQKPVRRSACAIISEEIYVRTQSFLRKIETGIARTPRTSVRQRLGKKDLRADLATGVGPVDGTLQNVAERISPEPGAQAGSGSHREADGAVFLR